MFQFRSEFMCTETKHAKYFEFIHIGCTLYIGFYRVIYLYKAEVKYLKTAVSHLFKTSLHR